MSLFQIGMCASYSNHINLWLKTQIIMKSVSENNNNQPIKKIDYFRKKSKCDGSRRWLSRKPNDLMQNKCRRLFLWIYTCNCNVWYWVLNSFNVNFTKFSYNDLNHQLLYKMEIGLGCSWWVSLVLEMNWIQNN